MQMLFALFGGLAMFLYGMDRMPRSGDSFTRVIQSRKTARPASGCKARPRMSMPSKSSPKENTASPTARRKKRQRTQSRALTVVLLAVVLLGLLVRAWTMGLMK